MFKVSQKGVESLTTTQYLSRHRFLCLTAFFLFPVQHNVVPIKNRPILNNMEWKANAGTEHTGRHPSTVLIGSNHSHVQCISGVSPYMENTESGN